MLVIWNFRLMPARERSAGVASDDVPAEKR